MEIELDRQTATIIQAKIESGDYVDAGDVIREALRVLDDRDRLRNVRSLLQSSEAQVRSGQLIDWSLELLEQLGADAETAEYEGRPIPSHVVP